MKHSAEFQAFDALVGKLLTVSHEDMQRREAEYRKQVDANPLRKPTEMIVYLAVNRVNQKAYVGITTKSLSHRFYVHEQKARLGYRSHFYSAIRKHGISAFDVAVLEHCASREDLWVAEKRWISELGSVSPFGYNISNGGQGASIAVFNKSVAWRESVTSEQVREKHSQRARVWRASMTPEQKALHQSRINESKKGKPNLKNRGNGNPATRPENKIKISQGQARAWADPVIRERRIRKIREAWARRKNK